ncbi:hypothetical protein [uncultured Neisseria sp.]|jgi:hypothetical protein|uniref:hypothetical protein n=1 Tax=uncultured Neisseria sp. TaxID=237778 RepID=UPI0025D4BEA4|nr:hypothetical protein [uncultured Neisseria sp.]
MAQKTFTDNDAKIVISGIIDAIWGKGVVASNKPENINDDVIEVVNDVVENIKRSTRPMLAIDITYNILYSAPGSLKEVLFGLAADMFANGVEDPNHNIIATYVGWLNALYNKRQYRTAIVTAALYNRSRLEMAFLGL